MHDTEQLQLAARRDEHIGPIFLGVHPADRIPTLRGKSCFILNTDSHDKPGQHWICVFHDGVKTFIYFDSYGYPPTKWNRHWSVFNSFLQNRVDLQQETSDVCGDYCLFVLKQLASQTKPSLEKTLKYLDVHDKKGNDFLIYELIHEEYPRSLNSVKHVLNVNESNFKRIVSSRQQTNRPRKVLKEIL